ncbi:accessory Sec system glycosylation chaperone GtfB [Staphylococcus edaphicus]|uniref:UDP-N-acetylglucosamine--peptide N-acetylglucosaminyltransferase stabilizing protein GtfB n=1 Tax=Staphylococcus edaphicus TaxID=1955013 RepID=A0A2C6WK45_9STAP|nr:accessory Sec system glycosylation chaperone GtfB [Staphylococcus edaphicus]PHK48749.1 accessory Sec system glycosylation chaperone GtfB [Staphylococcus edaphicus]UQW81673.1 accessory Sec system glycosylation chaperone GtfB [Staphylococcus edaphicus]
MINLFDVFDKKAIVLYKSFKHSGKQRQTIVIEENGFLPDDILTPYAFFANNPKVSTQPLFFNEVPIPRFWTIEGDNNMAFIKNFDEVKARIIYKTNYKYRIVERVEWLNKRGHTQYIDYYNKIGKRYAQVVLDVDSQKRILKRYFNYQNEVFMVENFVTNDIMLTWEDKEYFFHSKIQFVNFYLKVAKLDSENFMINSLSISSAVLNGLTESGHDAIFWQGDITPDIIKHLENALAKEKRNYKVMLPSPTRYDKVIELIDEQYKHRIIQSGYVYKFVKTNQHTNQVLILTNSDQIPYLEDIIQAQPSLEFHVAALTEMSMTLLKLNKYPNVNLYPNAKKAKFISLYKKCDIYLDINRGNEILDAVRAAFDYNLLILGYHETAHNKDVTYDDNLFDEASYMNLSSILGQIVEDKSVLDSRLKRQWQQAGSISKTEFIRTLEQ